MGAFKSLLLTALAIVLGTNSGLARADQVPDKGSTADTSAPAAPPVEAAPVAPPGSASRAVSDLPVPAVIPPTLPDPIVDPAAAEDSWFARAPLTLTAGTGARKISLTIFGFVEADYIFDTTRSYNDAIGGDLVARSDTYDGRSGRSQFSMRNSRLGFALESPTIGEVKPSAVLEGDFFGHQSSPPTTSENTYFDSPVFRIRHAYVKLQNPYVDVVAGQTYDLFGWQNFFFPCSVEFLGLPNQLFSRHAQLRLSHGFDVGGGASIDVAVSAARPAQRDSEIPDFNAGVRVSFDRWKGITTPGNVGTTAMPLSICGSGIVRQFKVDTFTPPPTQNSNSAMGWGVSADAFIPIIPSASAYDRGNRLTIIGSFVRGTGISDLINANGGAMFPTLPNPAQANPPPLYTPDIDNGLVTFDTAQGLLHTIDWQAYRVGLQYYLPPTGRLLFSANFTRAHSGNMAKLFPQGGAEIELLTNVADTSTYVDGNLFWDATPAVRFGISGQYTQVEYLDGMKPHNYRAMGQTVYLF